MVGVKKDVAYPVLTIPRYIKILFRKLNVEKLDGGIFLPQVDLRIREDSIGSLFIPAAHLSICRVERQTVDQKIAFFGGKEPGSFWPVGNDPE